MTHLTVRRGIAAALAATAVAISSCMTKEAGALLLNGDFEKGFGEQASGWSMSFYPGRDGIAQCIKRSETRARSGRWALKVDTGPVIGENIVLAFNAAVSREAARLRGEKLVFSGWVYVESGTAVRPIHMRLRTFGEDRAGKSVFLGDILQLHVLGKPGEWIPFRASGPVADAEITGLDLHCSIRPDIVRTLQFLDDLRLEPFVPPALELRPLRDALWRDESFLPVEVRVKEGRGSAENLALYLLSPEQEVVMQWDRAPTTGIIGLPLPETRVAEGRYVLSAKLRDPGEQVLASAEGTLYVARSPWEDAPAAPGRTDVSHSGDVPEGFRVIGTVAPMNAPELIPSQPEALSPDLDVPGQSERGYAVFSRHYLDGVSPLGRPRPGESGPLRLFACPGEYEPATVSVWAIQPLQKVCAVVSGLVGEGGTIAASNVDVRIVRRAPGLPPFLEKRPAVDVPAGQTRTFWLTVRVPPDASAGFYSGEVEIAPGESEVTRVKLLLRVLPLKLPPPQRGYGFWWNMDGRWDGYYSKERKTMLEHIRKQFVALREHGCNMASCYGMPKMTKAEDGTLRFDFEQDHWGHNTFSLADLFRLGRDTGLFSAKVPLQYPGAEALHSAWLTSFLKTDRDAAAFGEFYRDACQEINRWTKEQGFILAFACVDEIGNSGERQRDALRFYRIGKEAGILTSVTDNSMHGGSHLMGQSRFDDIIAMRLYNFITPEMIEHARNSGDRMWLYNMGSGGWDAKRDRFVFGFFTERCGADGCAQWAFQWAPGMANPYEAAAAGQSSGYHYALPAPDGPLPTLALEGVREGIDDARYLALLRQRAPNSAAGFLGDIETQSIGIAEYTTRHSGTFFDVRRWQAARELMKE